MDLTMLGGTSRMRLIGLVVLLALMGTGVGLLFGTHAGQLLLHDPHAFGNDVRRQVANHPIAMPVIFVAAYVLLVATALPVWWLDILAGVGFGIWGGIACCEFGATLGAIAGVLISRWLAADFFASRIEGRIAKLRKFDEKLDHNGFLVVMAVRLSHVAPLGVSNYIFGIIRITLPDVIVGTLLGGVPANTLSVMLGAAPHELKTRAFILLMVAMHVLLLIPLLLRYLKPAWFKRIGVE
jgi:uncharacterized membrane protein YdjX (TVP38/TMEM64 family)